MTFTTIEEHEFPHDDNEWYGDKINVGRDSRSVSEYQLVFDGPNGLETVIHFDAIEINRNDMTFYRIFHGRTIQTGSIEGSPESYGDVGAWIQAFCDDT